jgi:hypothetical protein
MIGAGMRSSRPGFGDDESDSDGIPVEVGETTQPREKGQDLDSVNSNG